MSVAGTAASAGGVALGATGVLSAGITAVVNNLFQSGVIKAQKNYIQMQTQLSLLSNEQQQALSVQLANTKDSNEKLQILTNAAAQVQAAQVQSSTGAKTTLIILVVGGAFALLVTAAIIHRQLAK